MQPTRKKPMLDSVVIGAALFAMFFGAGNMIFPAYLGKQAGPDWFSGFISYFLADIGLALVAIAAQIRLKEGDTLLSPLGNRFAGALMFAVMMCIGPFISIPRTAATTLELSIQPLTDRVPTAVFCVAFFALVLALCIKQSAVVDIVGKILTPLLFVGLLVLIIKGIVTPLGTVSHYPTTDNAIADGIEAGYQSMDALAGLVFGTLIFEAVSGKGYTAPAARRRVAAWASLVAGAGLCVVYLGMTWLGASVSALYGGHLSRTQLLIRLIGDLFPGNVGVIFFGVIAGLACLTTAIALTGSVANYLTDLTRKTVSYPVWAAILCVFSGAAASLGVDRLVAIAAPILNVAYPPILITVLLRFLDRFLPPLSVRLAAVGALFIGLWDVLSLYIDAIPTTSVLPLSSAGLGWIVPSFVLCAIGLFISRLRKKA